MYRRKFVVNILTTVLFSTLSTAGAAQSGLPLSGVVSKISPENRTVTVGEQQFILNPGVRVVDIKGQSLGKLKPNELLVGTYIKFKANRDEPLRRITTVSIPKL